MSTSSSPDQLPADQTVAGQIPTAQASPEPLNEAHPSMGSVAKNVVNITEEPDELDITESLLFRLKGKKIVIPNFAGVFTCWPHATSPEYWKLKTELESQMETILPDDYLRRKVRAADPALIVSMFWPNAPIPTLRILCHLVIWQGVFDDQIEMHNKHAPEKSTLLRAEMKNYINNVLAISPFSNVPDSFKDTAITHNFEVVADGIWSSYDEEQRRRFRDHLHRYIDATAEEEVMVEAGNTPEWFEYWELRGRAGGVSPLLGVLEFVAGPGLPKAFFESSEFVTACKSLNIVVSLTNDLVSMKKEMSARFVFSAIPILYNGLAKGDLDLAVAHVLFRIREAATSLGQALDTLEVQYSEKKVGPEAERVAKSVIGCLKHIMTGNFFWSVRCKRYGMAKCLKKDGSLVYTV